MLKKENPAQTQYTMTLFENKYFTYFQFLA